MITAAKLRETLSYTPETGEFLWLAHSTRVDVWDVAGCVDDQGYRVIRIHGRNYKAHRLAWLYVHGEWPSKCLDHINGERDDNRIANLREATNSQNAMNQKLRSDARSGLKGVHEHLWNGRRFEASIRIGGRRRSLGCFLTAEEAHARYTEEAARLFGEFARSA